MRQDNLLREAQKVRAIIQQREISVYDSPTNAESDDFFTVVQLETLLKKQLIGRTDLVGLAVRTRSRIAKALVCEALGYQAPRSFKRVSPRLPHPLIDVYAQQSTNLQIWNEEIDTERRYVILILEAYSAAGEMGFGWWLVEHYLSYHVNCPDGCGLGESTRGR